MHRRRLLRLVLVFSVVATLLLATVGTSSATHTDATYEVTIENLTAGQPLTPPVVATHSWFFKMFKVHRVASDELAAIARDGNLDPMVNHLNSSRLVNNVVVAATDVGPLLPGASVTFQISGKPWQPISFASMLVCTNDGFTGLDRAWLPWWGSRTYYAGAYDAGVEMNTELMNDLVPPCLGGTNNNAGIETSDPIMHHPGVQGTGDLTVGAHGWSDPVVKITIVRVD